VGDWSDGISTANRETKRPPKKRGGRYDGKFKDNVPALKRCFPRMNAGLPLNT
jgi:hypothetical protein